ncbi:hypothetical protein [Rubricoccus marinus]|uniref:AttH domain-containing protein n=1 Tax=Rubricoccus marinus TaxID=716817 RepID=A0A259TZ92_9BACT|nr:hypothetical protein [Rubricoccus marinus]OZC03095.1 hypothetical protein BSZ36_08985 [Rubricoccus marinus]
MTRLLWLAILAAAPFLCLRAQTPAALPENVLFDDFDYASTEWEQMMTGTPPAARGPYGSLYGPNEWVVSASGETAERRLWYRYAWQEGGPPQPERQLKTSTNGLLFSMMPGRHLADGCPDTTGGPLPVLPQQIASGFSARRGTWASHVNLGTLPSPERAAMINAFWLLSPTVGVVRQPDGSDVRITNEVDHEWNNRFLGSSQAYLFSSTGSTLGTQGLGRKAPMGTPLAPPPLGINYDREIDGAVADSWSCLYTRGETRLSLAPEACSALLQGRRVRGLPAPEGEVFATWLIHIGDDGTRFTLVSDGWGGRLEMESSRLSPPTQLEVFTLFSQHFSPGDHTTGCGLGPALQREYPFEVDWFLYSPRPDLERDEAVRVVSQIRSRGVSRLATIPGARLERPERPLVGHASDWGFGAWTTPLSLDVRAPRHMAWGETATLLALPPARHGAFRTTWTLATRYEDGRYERETRTEAFALPFTFASGVRTTLVHVRLEEVNESNQTVRNETVQPVEHVFMIHRRD